MVAESAHPEANIIFGAVIDDALGDEVRVTVIAAGFDGGQPGKVRTPARAVDEVPIPEPLTKAADSSAASGAEDTSRDEGDQYIELPERKAPRTIVFDDSSSSSSSSGDDLDVPDFLK
jgi:cell division protein FtsZ